MDYTITISRQMGSLSCEIAQEVASSLSYKLVWRDLINKAARLANVPEMALVTIDELGLLDLDPSEKAFRAYKTAVEEVMQELASEGKVVIIGRAGQVILRQCPTTLHVRLIAPCKLRAERISHIKKIPLKGAIAQVEISDRYRANYLKKFYNVQWDNPELYHVVINTAQFSITQAAKIIINAVHQFTDNSLSELTSQGLHLENNE